MCALKLFRRLLVYMWMKVDVLAWVSCVFFLACVFLGGFRPEVVYAEDACTGNISVPQYEAHCRYNSYVASYVCDMGDHTDTPTCQWDDDFVGTSPDCGRWWQQYLSATCTISTDGQSCTQDYVTETAWFDTGCHVITSPTPSPPPSPSPTPVTCSYSSCNTDLNQCQTHNNQAECSGGGCSCYSNSCTIDDDCRVTKLEVISRTVNDPNATCGQIAAVSIVG